MFWKHKSMRCSAAWTTDFSCNGVTSVAWLWFKDHLWTLTSTNHNEVYPSTIPPVKIIYSLSNNNISPTMALLQSAANYVEWETCVQCRKGQISLQVSAVWFDGKDFQVINICLVLRECVWATDWILWLACVRNLTCDKANSTWVHLTVLNERGTHYG